MKPSFKDLAVSTLVIALGNLFYTLIVLLFFKPSGLVTGGVTGIALALSALGLGSTARFVTIANIIFWFLGLLLLGWRFALSTLLSTALYPIFISFLEPLLAGVVLTNDMVLCTVFSGIGMGASLGIVIRAGASSGGVDVISLALNKYFKLPVSACMNAVDVIIVAAQLLVFPPENLLYGIIGIVIYTMVLDKVLLLGTTKTEVKVVSEQSEAIRKLILTEADRGVTVLHGQGGYLGAETEILLSVISNRELPKVERLIHSVDPKAFMIVTRVSEVSGRGFTLGKEYR